MSDRSVSFGCLTSKIPMSEEVGTCGVTTVSSSVGGAIRDDKFFFASF